MKDEWIVPLVASIILVLLGWWMCNIAVPLEVPPEAQPAACTTDAECCAANPSIPSLYCD